MARSLLSLLLVAAFFSSSFAVQKKEPAKKSPKQAKPDVFATAREHIQKGRLAEANEALDKLAKTQVDPVRLTLLRARINSEQGKWKESADTLQAAIKAHPKKAALIAALAEVQFHTGDYKQSEANATKAIKLDANQPLAHLVLADTYTETGRTKEAFEHYRWFIGFYNKTQPKDEETLLHVAHGSLQYARWRSVTGVFRFIINTLCPDAQKADPNSWRSFHISGDVLLEKYNRPQALKEFESALAINPNAVPVLVSMGKAAEQKLQREKAVEYADKALKLVPNHVEAMQLKADVLIGLGKIGEAVDLLNKALKVNPHEQRTLARLAACFVLIDGPPAEKDLSDLFQNIDAVKNVSISKPDRFSKLVIELAKRNPKPGYFLAILGETLESRRKFDLAERCYKTASRVMPELSAPKNSLGMLYMRIGRTKEAKKILDSAFKSDPFHVRVFNMRKVLGVLEGYESIASPHFVVRVDSTADKILGQYMSEYLEEIYPDLVKQFKFEPPHRTQFEIYNNAKGQSGHEWFSARLIGLPWIHTIGASTGVIVAMTSPTASGKTFNWARVVKHEFVHVITLQQTKFNIPHWFTEALAVTAEGYPRTETWDKLLLERVPKGDLRTLANLNDGFIRPRNSLDWQFAYCQSKLYARYMVEKYGKESIPKLLEAYRKNMPTAKGIEFATGADIATFEKGHREFLNKLVAGLKAGQPTISLADAAKAYKADETNTKAAGEYAYALYEKAMRNEARAVAEKAIAKNPKEPLVAYVMAKLSLLANDDAAATKYLTAAHDKSKPSLPVLRLLADLKLKDGKTAESIELLELGRKTFPYDESLMLSLARAYIKLDENDKLFDVLVAVSDRNFDDASIRKRLMELSFAKKDYKAVAKWGREVLFIDVLNVDAHRLLGLAYRELKDYKKSTREYTVALQIKPDTAELQLGLAKTHIAAGEKAKAKTLVDAVLAKYAENAEAKKLLDELK